MMPPSIAESFAPHQCTHCGSKVAKTARRDQWFGWRRIGWRVRLSMSHAGAAGDDGRAVLRAFGRTLQAIGINVQACTGESGVGTLHGVTMFEHTCTATPTGSIHASSTCDACAYDLLTSGKWSARSLASAQQRAEDLDHIFDWPEPEPDRVDRNVRLLATPVPRRSR